MICYLYNKGYQPPASFIHVTLRRPDGAKELTDVPAQIDHGAGRTVLPTALVEQLELVAVDTVFLEGFGGTVTASNTYAVVIQVRNLAAAHTVEVAGNPHEPCVLLGRDVLNHHRVLLDGPQLRLEIS